MGKFDQSIEWLQEQIRHASEAIADLRRGHRIQINDEDVSQDVMSMHERLIARYKQLIGAYEKRND